MARPDIETSKPTPAPKSAPKEATTAPRTQADTKPVFTDYASL